MIRLTALNDESSRSSVDDEVYPKEPPQEVQEENALKLYNEALQEQRNGNVDKAEELYKQLLMSSFLMKVKPDEDNMKGKKPDSVFSLYSNSGLMLKYSCLKNLAVLSQKKNLLNEALDFYNQALDVEGTDVSMWFQAGSIALKLFKITTALEAFLKGLEYSPNHWPSLDKLIMCLFILHDYVNCLHFISRAFDIDVNYTRGQVLRDYIIKEQPSLQFDIKCFFPKINLHLEKKSKAGDAVNNKLLNETLSICNEYTRKCKEDVCSSESSNNFVPSKTIKAATWMELGEFILQAEKDMTQGECFNLNTSISLEEASAGMKILSEVMDQTLKEAVNSSEGVDPGRSSEEDPAKKTADGSCEKKSKKNKGSALMEELLWGGKRRSARVRSSLRGNPEPMDVAEALRRILPRKLLHKSKQAKMDNPPLKSSNLEENSMDTMDLYKLFERQESAEEKKQAEEQKKCEIEQDIDFIVESEGYFGKKDEEEDVKSFIRENSGQNIIDLTRSFVMKLKTLWSKTWPNPLPAIYIEAFQVMRKHYPLDFNLCVTDSKFKSLVEESGCVLLYGELCLEHSVLSREKPSQDVLKTTTTTTTTTPMNILFLQNVMELTERREMFESDENYVEFLLRLYWLRCRIFLEKGQTNLAIVALNDVLACYDLYPSFESKVLELKNCRKHNTISKPIAEEFLAFQSRKRSLAEVVRLYEDESYQELTEILKDTFTTSPTDTASTYFKEQDSEMVDRQTQLAMLINGLYHLNEFKECVYWLETCCYEILQKASTQLYATGDDEGESWMVTLDGFLVAMEDCLKLGKLTVTEALPQNRVSRFVQTLCHAICKELEDSDRPPCPARPWIMLNTILIGMEAEEGKVEFNTEEDDEENDIPSSILILFTAHEYLGRREWCTCNDSILLFVIMDQVIPHMRDPEWSSFRETVQQHLEQVIYCLYSHPNKKSKARYLTDHNVNSIPLTWQRGIQLFDLFRPDEIPSYDSLRINLISSETEVLFRRIAALIPDEKDPVQISDKMTEFIVGKRNDVPVASVLLPDPVKDLFYILGDYYFKTHEFAKAVNYLLMDLCANPDRVDSWASMALARASLLEQQLNSCDSLKEEEFLQSALSALRCYEHCLQLDNKQCALWIEYGSFLYTIHSFCSQRMKSESFNLSLEQFEELESTKNKMLETAKQAFVNANLIWYEIKEESERQDERWLHHYMLGKICEKNDDFNYFDHYEKAADLLYENEAEFPSKVGYTAPQTLAIEALEVYYRVHVCIIKNLELNEGKPLDSKTRQLFNKYLNNCSNGPFASQMSKGDLAKIKAKELELAQKEKHLKAVSAVLNDMIDKIEREDEEFKRAASATENANDTIVLDSTFEAEGSTSILVREGQEAADASVENVHTDMDVDMSSLKDGKPGLAVKEDEETGKFNEEAAENEIKMPENDEKPESMIVDLSVDAGTSNRPAENVLYSQEEPKPSKIKRKRRSSNASQSSSSNESEIRYEDESSSSSSSSGSSASSQTSSSSSSESSPSDTGQKDGSKATDEEDKESDHNKQTATDKSSIDEGEDKSEYDFNQSEVNSMVTRCLKAFETCALRFPQHYKSVYRLAHFYFRSKDHKDIGKCRELLLGRYQTANGTIPGLFAERKNTNFFNGIWRIPAGDVDRPGSFASHMSRSVLLLMEVLRDLKDHKMLLEICLQLRKTPEPDKKYLREGERNQLSVQACDLAIQTLRKNVKDSSVMTLPLVLDCYRCYQKVQKHYGHKESIYGDILLEAFKRLGRGDKCTLEQALRFCQSEVSTVKPKIPKNIAAGTSLTPKPAKPKKEEKKKITPKPQLSAKAVPKPAKVKKSPESKKPQNMNILPPSVLMDPAFWSSMIKPPVDAKEAAKSALQGAQMYAEMLRATALSVKQREQMDKKVADQMAIKTAMDQLKSTLGQKFLPGDMIKAAGYYPFLNYMGEMAAKTPSFWGNLSLFPGTSLPSFPAPKKNKPKPGPSKQQSILKPNIQRTDSHGKSEEASKPRTNFNIEDILGKPSITVTKTSLSSGSSGQSAPSSGTPSSSSGLIKSIEEKIKSISKEVNITKCPGPQAANLSGKRTHPESETANRNSSSVKIKKICQRSDQPAGAKIDDIEVVVIDD